MEKKRREEKRREERSYFDFEPNARVVYVQSIISISKVCDSLISQRFARFECLPVWQLVTTIELLLL